MDIQFLQTKKKKSIFSKISKVRLLTILVIGILIFNLLSTKFLPSDVFLVFAADIDVNELITLANAERSSRDISTLTVDSRLVRAAQAKGEDMIAKDYWAHYGPDGESPWDFILASGYDYIYAGENLAKDFSSAAPIHSAWMASPSHRSNILNDNFENIGIAAVTGEFQGKQTTLVVQMFGKTQSPFSSDSSTFESSNNLPTTGEEGDIKSPIITEPKEGEILSEAAFSVRGQAEEGDRTEIFDNGESVGITEVMEKNFTFKKSTRYGEGDHILYAKASDSEGKVSGASNIVNVTVDTIAPYIAKDTAKFEYAETGVGFRRFVFSVEVDDNPNVVKGEYRDEELMFYYVEDRWEFIFEERQGSFEDLKVIASDAAGNSTEVMFSKDEISSLAEEIPIGKEMGATVRKWIIEDIFSRIFTRSLRGQVNFIIAFLMLVILSVEWFILTKTGYTKERSSSIISICVFALVLFVGILGGGGEVL